MPVRCLFSLSLLVFASACCKHTVPDEAPAPMTAEKEAPLEPEEEAAAGSEIKDFSELEDIEWKLVEWNEGDAVSADITLLVDEGKFVGKAACNRYFVPVSEGEEPGEISVGQGGMTRMMCDPDANTAERRFMKRLSETTRFDVVDGKLALASPEGRLLFDRAGQ